MHWYKVCIFFLKYFPALALLLLTIHVGLLLAGYNECWSEYICTYGAFSMLLLIAASYALQFCVLHRVVVVYNYLVSACINFQRSSGFGEYVTFFRWLVLVTGIVLFILFLQRWHLNCKKS